MKEKESLLNQVMARKSEADSLVKRAEEELDEHIASEMLHQALKLNPGLALEITEVPESDPSNDY